MMDMGAFFFCSDVGATLFVGFVAGLVAIWGVVTQRIIARRHATIEIILTQQADRDIIEARKKFIALAKEDGGLAKWADLNKEGLDDTNAIHLVLNQYEILAIGIQRGVVDFHIYKLWNKSQVLRYWQHAAPFVHALRARVRNDMIYYEFEQMSDWMKDQKRPRRNRWFGLFF